MRLTARPLHRNDVTFHESRIEGVFEIRQERHTDDRGYFARVWCQREFEIHGLAARFVQSSVSFNQSKGTLRGVHYQAQPHPEAKLVRCTRGALYDVVVDLRRYSRTFGEWTGTVLTADNGSAIYVPEDCGHGFLTLEDRTEVSYHMSEFYDPELSRGVRWDDPAFGIELPGPVAVISERDRTYPDFRL